MKAYADLHLCPSVNDTANAQSMAKILAELQVMLVGLVVPPDRSSSSSGLINAFKGSGIDVATRLDLRPRSREELLRNLRRFRDRYELVAVECGSPTVARVAVRDRRVDIVYFPRQQRGSTFRESLASTCKATLEFNLSELISGSDIGGRLRSLGREIQVAHRTSTCIIGSSRAANPFQLRSPRDIASVLHAVGLPLDKSLRTVSEIPINLVKENRSRIRRPRLENGVRIIKRQETNE